MKPTSRNEDQVALTLLDNPRNNLVAKGELLQVLIGEVDCLGVKRILSPQLGSCGGQKGIRRSSVAGICAKFPKYGRKRRSR